MPKRSSSGRWLQRQRKDPYVKQAHEGGWRSRAVYKLEEIDRRDRLFRPGQRIVDLGAAPGGWCQYAVSRLQGKGRVIGLDLLPIDPIAGVDLIEGDFRKEEVLAELSALVEGQALDLVLSDMAPNFSGIRDADLARSYELAELARDFAVQHLAQGGSFLVKLFQGADFEAYRASLRKEFAKVMVRKPDASRAESREFYLLAQGLLKGENG